MNWIKLIEAMVDLAQQVNNKEVIMISNILDVKQLATKVGIGRDKAYTLMKLKGFPSFAIGSSYRVFEDDLEKFLKEHRGLKIILE